MIDHHATRNRNAAKSEPTEPPAESFDDDLTADEIMSQDEANRAKWDAANTQDRFE